MRLHTRGGKPGSAWQESSGSGEQVIFPVAVNRASLAVISQLSLGRGSAC